MFHERYTRKGQGSSHLAPRPERNELSLYSDQLGRMILRENSNNYKFLVWLSQSKACLYFQPAVKMDDDLGNQREVNPKVQVTPHKIKTSGISCLQRKIAVPVICPDTMIK